MGFMRDGRLLFSGDITEDNIEEVTQHCSRVLNGKRFTMVTANQAFGYRPEVRVGVELREGVVLRPATLDAWNDIKVGSRIDLTDDDFVMSLWASRSSSRPRNVTIHERSILVEHYAPGGNHMWWSWTQDDHQWEHPEDR